MSGKYTELFISSGYKFVNWIFRAKNLVIKTGSLLALIGFGGGIWNSIQAKYITENGAVTELAVKNEQGPFYESVLFIIGCIGVLFIIFELIYIIRKRQKTANIVIEHIALKNKLGSSLNQYINNSETLPIDLFDCYTGFHVSDPQLALDMTVIALAQTLPAKIKESGKSEITIHYGGTPPVALGFLAGSILGNTYDIKTWDYVRDEGVWYPLDEYRGSDMPKIDLMNYKANPEVLLIMAITYPINLDDITIQFPGIPYVLISMDDKKHDNMRCQKRLTEFQSEFRELLKKLNYDGVETAHIFCAAQASFNFAMGRQVNRNHSQCIVYEYDRSQHLKYPWGVSLNGPLGPSLILSQ